MAILPPLPGNQKPGLVPGFSVPACASLHLDLTSTNGKDPAKMLALVQRVARNRANRRTDVIRLYSVGTIVTDSMRPIDRIGGFELEGG
jgi:hypothetical protein